MVQSAGKGAEVTSLKNALYNFRSFNNGGEESISVILTLKTLVTGKFSKTTSAVFFFKLAGD